MKRLLLIFTLVTLLSINIQCSDLESSKLVHVSLLSNWGFTPLHYESAEFINKQDKKLYWKFIDSFVDTINSKKREQLRDKDIYELILQSSRDVVDSNTFEFLKLNLAQRTMSPKVEVYRQLSIAEKPKDGVHSDWFVYNGKMYTDSKDIDSLDLSESLVGDNDHQILYEFDHVYSGNVDSTLPILILYGDITTEKFQKLHQKAKKFSDEKKVNYVLRYVISESSDKVYLQGYGFELALKNLEYKVMDDSSIKKDADGQSQKSITIPNEDVSGFNFFKLSTRKPELLQKLSTFRSFLLAHSQQFDELKVWELKDLGIQTAQKVISSSDPLRSLKYISQHFPTLANSLARISVNETLKKQMESNQKFINPQESLVLLNGRVINTETINTLTLTDMLQEELQPLTQIQSLGIQTEKISQLCDKASVDPDIRYRVLPEDLDAIIYLNNMDSNVAKGWTKSLEGLGKDTLDENGIQIARNLLTTVMVVDPSNTDAVSLLSDLSEFNQQVTSPSRFGFIFSTFNKPKQLDAASPKEIARLFIYIKNKAGLNPTLFLFRAMNYYRRMFSPGYISKAVMTHSIQAIAQQYRSVDTRSMNQAMQSVDHDITLQEMNNFVQNQMSIASDSAPLVFLNGRVIDLTNPKMEFSDQLLLQLANEFNQLKPLYTSGDITEDSSNLYKDILESKHWISVQGSKLLDTMSSDLITPEPTQYLKLLFNSKDSQLEKDYGKLLKDAIYYPAESKDTIYPITHLIIGDFDQKASRDLVLNMIEYQLNPENQEISSNVRFSIINCPMESSPNIFGKYLLSVRSQIKSLEDLKREFEKKLTDIIYKYSESNENLFHLQTRYARDYLRVNITENVPVVIVTNGRLTEIKNPSQSIKTIHNLNVMELKKSKTSLEILTGTEKLDNNLMMVAQSMVSNHMKNPNIERRSIPNSIEFSFRVINTQSPMKFTLVLNPFTKVAQKIVPIVEAFSKTLNISVDVLVNPPVSISEFPMKNYYHYVMQLDMKFDDKTGKLLSSQTSGTITNLPESRVLTLAMDIPGSWLVQPIVAKYDLDNIRLKDLGQENVLNAVFELENLVVEGSCLDVTLRGPPAGLEIELTPVGNSLTETQDTIVMSNLGYYQLKSNPGIWKLSLKPGRSSDISQIYDSDKEITLDHQSVIIDQLYVPTGNLYIRRKKGKEYESLIQEDEEPKQPQATKEPPSLWSSFFPKKKSIEEKKKEIQTVKNSDPELIHVFSVASGHLYERFLKIMMLSVTKNTDSPVKFWFLKNYLSPGFKEFIPKMAEELGFQYELVTYKWPWWLRKQTEKQRIIWSYKILFLDVLFPLDVKKIIFVDADQVVRTDMKELWDMNLQGASLGLTPFCDSNKDTEGFRFWKTGYWRDHLRGKPYHISALYVVDLQKFRRITAGDQLRATYDQLSRDPNSLANLDQDLPNYLQHQVKIFSLPQEWLWCETWCDQSSKSKAKTIDLCNNPLTKTPKLQNAVRIISEWTSLDNEAKDLDLKFDKEKEKNQQKQQIQKDLEKSKIDLADLISDTLNEAQKLI
ncbi:glycosyltransferase [Tieghemostelium lacteum]|uniref:Glycosyltransferase n=1 Tax=Tieghemostelium lacteum TaxID=361077 RepID=A0A152A0Q0_TIELA|nr:glycosyltransferase [Tieghemostelium lacteum]|eukprot:KYQ99832.1 glycosyltransferase [Tieghemostelium lacteum]